MLLLTAKLGICWPVVSSPLCRANFLWCERLWGKWQNEKRLRQWPAVGHFHNCISQGSLLKLTRLELESSGLRTCQMLKCSHRNLREVPSLPCVENKLCFVPGWFGVALEESRLHRPWTTPPGLSVYIYIQKRQMMNKIRTCYNKATLKKMHGGDFSWPVLINFLNHQRICLQYFCCGYCLGLILWSWEKLACLYSLGSQRAFQMLW